VSEFFNSYACLQQVVISGLPLQEVAQATRQRVTASVCFISGAVLAFPRFPHVPGANILFVALG
jgi:hypothetical protein